MKAMPPDAVAHIEAGAPHGGGFKSFLSQFTQELPELSMVDTECLDASSKKHLIRYLAMHRGWNKLFACMDSLSVAAPAPAAGAAPAAAMAGANNNALALAAVQEELCVIWPVREQQIIQALLGRCECGPAVSSVAAQLWDAFCEDACKRLAHCHKPAVEGAIAALARLNLGTVYPEMLVCFYPGEEAQLYAASAEGWCHDAQEAMHEAVRHALLANTVRMAMGPRVGGPFRFYPAPSQLADPKKAHRMFNSEAHEERRIFHGVPGSWQGRPTIIMRLSPVLRRDSDPKKVYMKQPVVLLGPPADFQKH